MFFRQFGLNAFKALRVPVMSNQVLNQASQWQVRAGDSAASYKLMMMSSCWWMVTTRQRDRQLIFPHRGRRGHGSRLPYWTMCFTHCPPSVCHSLLHCPFTYFFAFIFFPFQKYFLQFYFTIIHSMWITTLLESHSQLSYFLPPFFYDFYFIHLSIAHLFLLSFFIASAWYQHSIDLGYQIKGFGVRSIPVKRS